MFPVFPSQTVASIKLPARYKEAAREEKNNNDDDYDDYDYDHDEIKSSSEGPDGKSAMRII